MDGYTNKAISNDHSLFMHSVYDEYVCKIAVTDGNTGHIAVADLGGSMEPPPCLGWI